MMINSNKVLICHPGRQHSHQAALALYKADMLAGYWTGVPCLGSHRVIIPRSIWDRFIRYAELPLPKTVICWNPISLVMNRLARFMPHPDAATWIEYEGYRLFDRWAAKRLSRLKHKPQAVIAYENSALEMFNTAKRLGITAILDAASVHHQTQDGISQYRESNSLHSRINLNKDREIELADYILTVSNLARKSYLEAGVPQEKVFALPLGVDLHLFKPVKPAENRKSSLETNPHFTFLFSGSTICRRKGVDLLLQAFAKLCSKYPNIQLRFAGTMGDAAALLPKGNHKKIILLGPLTQADLAKEYQRAVCFVLPSRHDSFGMAVAEALACGVPAIVSDQVGAKEMIREGANGWICPVNDADALAERMLWCAQNIDTVRAMSAACRNAAKNYSWDIYQKRLIDFLQSIL